MVAADTLIKKAERTAAAERMGMDDIAAAMRDDARLFKELKMVSGDSERLSRLRRRYSRLAAGKAQEPHHRSRFIMKPSDNHDEKRVAVAAIWRAVTWNTRP